MRLLLFVSSLGSGGAERQVSTLGLLMKRNGIDVEVLVYHDEQFYEEILTEAGIVLHKVLETNPIKRMLKIRRLIRASKYNVVVSFLDVPNFINCFAAVGGKNWKVITTERSSKIDFFFTRKGKIFSWFQRYSDRIVCNSENAKLMWSKCCPYYKDKLSVIYNAVNLPKTKSTYTPKRDGKLNIVIAASYQKLKNPQGVIKALSLMSSSERNHIKVTWYGRQEIIPGDTQAYDESLQLIKKYQLEDVIFLHSETKCIADKMFAADAVGLFSMLEGLPNSICEAMSLGKPIVMSRVSDFSNLVDDNGVVCDWDEPEDIKNALLELCSKTPEQLADMGSASRSKAKKLFDQDSVSKKWIELFI